MGITLAVLFMWSLGLPASVLAKKPALGEAVYASGWENGCQSGIYSQAPLQSPFSKQPFVRQEQNSDNYKQGWNEGFTTSTASLFSTPTAISIP